uniref:Chromo domain-containing protein n=1 Tax=Salix viminalis TaxID=40686 RepID=A0A6N2NAG1_SALVM
MSCLHENVRCKMTEVAEFQFSSVFHVEDLTTYHGSTSVTGLEETPTIPQISSTPEVVDSMLAHRYVSTRRGCNKFLVHLASKPHSEAAWLHEGEVHCLNPELLQDYVQHYLLDASCLWSGEVANSGDQNISTRSKNKNEELIDSDNMNRGDKGKDFAKSKFSGKRCAVKAQVPANYVEKGEQLVSNN